MEEKIIILDFGSQTTQLIGRRIRELNVYCEIVPYNKFPHGDESVKGVILSGSPFSVYDQEAFKVDLSGIRGRLPILGICYGAQFIAYTNGGKVEPAGSREYGRARLGRFEHDNPLLKGVREHSQVWMSHGDTITAIPDNFRIIASTDEVAIAAYQVEGERMWGVQFHPEVYHSVDGTLMLKNFVVDICGCHQTWSSASFVDSTVAELKEQIGNDRVILGLSGGVDSSVAAVLLNRAIGRNLTCIFVDHGLLRKNEFHDVLYDYECLGLNVIGVDASEKFFKDLEGVSDPEQKRKIIGRDFVEVFNAEARKITDARWLAQGTIYPDRIESLNITGKVIKSHHNVGGLPKETVRAAEVALQGRGAPRGPRAGHTGASHRPPSFPRPRLGRAHPGRHHPGEGAHPARCRRHLHPWPARLEGEGRRGQGSILVRPGMASRRHPAARPQRGRHGRRTHLRARRGPACRHLHRRHDCRLGPPALRVPGASVQRHY